jgi:hypothetical protein
MRTYRKTMDSIFLYGVDCKRVFNSRTYGGLASSFEHLNVKEMLPYFHASGHFPHAKSAHLYLQDMLQLQNCMNPSFYQKFTEGFFTVSRSDKLNCGTSTDMVIEQSMMKAMKTDGGLARGNERECHK